MENARRVVPKTLGWACIAAICGCLVVGCGGKDEPKGASDGNKAPSATAKPATTQPAAAVPAGSPTPAQWVDSMASLYQSAVKDTIAALNGTPPADQALPKMQAVYEKCIQQHLPMGRQYEAMAPADRKKAESSFAMKLMSLQSSEDFKAYIKLSNGPYSTNTAKTDNEKECARLVRGINIISQYGQFDLLRKQEPNEALRLGVK